MEDQSEKKRRSRRSFSAEEKARVVGLYEGSGLRRSEFCRREGISPFNLQRWIGNRRRAAEAAQARFVEMECAGVAAQGRCRYRVGFVAGAWLEVESGFDEREVRVLAGIVREAGRC